MGLWGRGRRQGVVLPAGYLAAEFVETQANTGTIYNSVIVTSATGFKTEYMHTAINNPGQEPFLASDYKGNWMIPPRPYGTCAYWGTEQIRYLPVQVGEWLKVEMNYLNDSKLTLNGGVSNLPDIGNVTFGELRLLRGRQKLKFLEITQQNKKSNKLIPVIDESGKVCLFDSVLKETIKIPSTNLVAGLTLAQAKQLSKLSATGGTLTISLPWETQLDYGVYEALQTAKANGWTITVQYRDPEPDNAVYNKYAECVTVDDVKAVNADYANDLTPAGEWIYPLPNLENANNSFSHAKGGKLIIFRAALPKVTSISYMFGHKGTLEVFESCDMPSLINGYQAFIGNAKLTRFVYSMPALFNGGGMFSGCKLDKESVLVILNSIPAYTSGTHNITLGIHVDHETDEEVIAAIAEAEAKGWTVTVQWNGTATVQTASTFGLRRPAIYAKVVEFAGEKHLDWGHYVTNWEENGYQEFASVEEAKEHFNIED